MDNVVRGLFCVYDRRMGVERGTVAVVGAGPAGLAAAWRLWSAGRRVRVYEGRDRAGGRLRTEHVAGVGADPVVQLLSADYSRTLELVEALGVRSLLVEVPGRDALWRGGRAHAVRYGSAARMAASGALPVGLKLRLGLRYLPFLERHAAALDLNDLAGTAVPELDAESIAAWGRRELGDEFVEIMVYPLLAAYYGVTPEETSAALFHALARAGLGVTVLGMLGGAGTLSAALSSALEGRGVELAVSRPVEALEVGEAAVRVRSGNAWERHDAVVVAVPAPVAAGLVPEVPWLRSVRTRSTATLVLALRSPLRTGWFGLSIPRLEPPGRTLAAVCVQAEKETGVVGGEGGSVVLVPSPDEGERWMEMDAGAIADAGAHALDQVLPGVRREVVEARVVRLPAATFVPSPGHFRRLKADDPATWPARLALAGDYLASPTVEGAVRSGLAAADRIIRAGW